MIDLKAALAAASLPERTVMVCLNGALVTAANDAVQAAVSSEGPQALAVAAAQQAVAAAALPFRLRALTRPAWTSLVAMHPPRPDNMVDAQTQFNTDTFPEAALRASLVDPDVTDDGLWQQLLNVLPDAEFDELYGVTVTLAKVKTDIVPFSSPASAGTGRSGGKSSKPAG